MAVDATGSIYIADTNNNRIRKVTADGNINTIAGTGTAEYLGDGGPASSSLINHPQSLIFDANGNLLFADTGNHVIRKIDTRGIITTVVGNGSAGFSGDRSNARTASLNRPEAIAMDGSGNLYIADTFNQRVRVVLTDGNIYSIAGTGIAGFSGDSGAALIGQMNFPRGIAVDAIGIVYVSDNGNHVIRQLSPLPSGGNLPIINPNGVVSASDFGALNTAAVGSWVEIYGSNLSSTTRGWTFGDFSGIAAPQALDGVTVTMGGQPAVISYVSPGQVNALIASNAATGLQQVQVTTPAGAAAPFNITLRGTQPRLAAPPGLNAGGRQYAAAFFLDGSYVLPPSGTGRRRARTGDVITLYGLGFGSLSPAAPAGQIVTRLETLNAPFRIFFDGKEGQVLHAGISPLTLTQTMYNVGLYQFNVVVPAGVTVNDFVPLTFTLDGVAGTQTLYTAIGN